MEKRTKLGVAATSLAAAAAMIGPTSASAVEVCIECEPTPPGDAVFVFDKIETAFDDLFNKIEFVAPGDVFIKLEDVFHKLTDVFFKY